MITSTEIKEISAALALAQAELEAAHKDSDNPYFKSKYADLASVWDACRKPLTKNGLSVVQVPSADGSTVKVTTRLLHSSGEWIQGELSSTAKDASPQSIGSAVTYLRRYSLQSLVGIAPEDDDGNAATGQEPRQQTQAPPKGKAKAVAEQHGMKTADELPEKKTLSFATIKAGLKSIDPSAPNARERLNKADDLIYASLKAKVITEAENDELVKAIAELQREIDGHRELDKQAATAAA